MARDRDKLRHSHQAGHLPLHDHGGERDLPEGAHQVTITQRTAGTIAILTCTLT